MMKWLGISPLPFPRSITASLRWPLHGDYTQCGGWQAWGVRRLRELFLQVKGWNAWERGPFWGASVILQNQERSGLPNHIYPCGHLKYSVYLFPFLECFPQKSFLSVLMATKGEHNGWCCSCRDHNNNSIPPEVYPESRWWETEGPLKKDTGFSRVIL